MVTLAKIVSSSRVSDPDLDTVFRKLHEMSEPMADAKKPMLVIAPVVNKLHSRARIMQFDLTAKNLTPDRLRTAVSRSFSKITDHYVILVGIKPPTDPVERIQYDNETKFARELLEITFRLFMEVGGSADLKWEIVMPAEPRREAYSAELKNLRTRLPLPDFALKQNQAKKSEIFAGFGWLIITLIILLRTGLLGEIIEGIAEALSGK